jgi:hypothetical protein
MLTETNLRNHVFFPKGGNENKLSYLDEKKLQKKFLELSDVKRIFVSSKYEYGEIEDIIEQAFVPEVGLSFRAFCKLLGYLSSVKYLDEDKSLVKPLSKFTCLLYELCVVNFTDFREIVYSFDFHQCLKMKESEREKLRLKEEKLKKAGKWRKSHQTSNKPYT